TELSTKRHASFPEGGTGPGIGACGALAPEAGCLDAGGSTNHTVCDGANLDASTPALQTSGNATLLCLASASGKFNMTNLALRLEFLNASVPVATAWIVDAGSFHYQLSSTQARDIWFSAGNVYRREGDARYLDGGLSIPPSAPAGEGRAHAIQLVRLEGASSLSGLGTYTLTNVGRTALADFANVSSVSLAVSGPGRVPVMAGLVDATSGYDFGYEGREIEGWPAYEASRKGSLLPYSFRLFFARIHVES
ncbi:MAG TPA: hypothetical protein VM681_07665, partial [Candidatus Thermoplasmatota archaeon]|nr:hypothetical protein [Candidatus Thermoplasmatota archaeon]